VTRLDEQPRRHRFILNPYSEERFAFCPRCDRATKQRKFPLLIHVEPRNPVALNKTCCYCRRCDLIIAHQDELELQLAALFANRDPTTLGREYLVMGTLDHDVWDRGLRIPLSIPEMLANLHVFQEVLGIEPTRGRSR
jgi:hypothetical protein